MKQKVKYLQTCLRKNVMNEGFSCPSCGQADSSVVSRKYLVTALRRCKNCQLLFRTPTTSAQESAAFYQDEYTQGFTTDCPSDELLAKLLENKFKNSGKDYSTYIDVICAAGGVDGSRLFDFGCSWGYGSWQFMQRGFDVESFDVSVPRATYARTKLGIKVHSSLSEVSGSFDVFFSSHVLEHVPSVKQAIEFGMQILKPGGLFVAFTPNGSLGFRRKEGKAWKKLWGLVHPNLLDDKYYRATFSGKRFLLSSDPYPIKEIEKWRVGHSSVLPLDGVELLLLTRK